LKGRQKKGRPRLENPMVHTAVVLPLALLEQLRKDAVASHKGLSTEIRERLMQTYVLGGEWSDPDTDDLLAAIKLLARNLARDLGKKWHRHPYVLKAFKAGVMAFLSRYQLKDHEGNGPDNEFSGEPDDPPEGVGRTHARLIAIGTHRDNEEDIRE
jgi:hypothetical protein